MSNRKPVPAKNTDTTVLCCKTKKYSLSCLSKEKIPGFSKEFQETHLPDNSYALLTYRRPDGKTSYIIHCSTSEGEDSLENVSRPVQVLCKVRGKKSGRLEELAREIRRRNNGYLDLTSQAYGKIELLLATMNLRELEQIIKKSQADMPGPYLDDNKKVKSSARQHPTRKAG